MTLHLGLAEEILREEKSRELASERAGLHNSDELATLGTRLGETYAMREITGLLHYKRASARPKSPKALMMEREMSQNNIDVEKAPDQAVQNFRNSSYYKIKCYILKILAEVSKHSQFIGVRIYLFLPCSTVC